MRAILATCVANSKQRLRTQGFWLTLFVLCIATLFAFPTVNAQYTTIDIFGYRGFYNSHFMGDTLSLLNALLLPLVGFYLIKNALWMDEHSKAHILIMSSPVSMWSHLIGKWLSNTVYLLALVFAMLTLTLLLQLYIGESYEVSLWGLIRSHLYTVVPVLLVVSALALVFEATPILKTAGGNAIYFFLWTPLVIFTMESGYGISVIVEQMEQQVSALDPIHNNVNIGGSPLRTPMSQFLWLGTDYELSKVMIFFAGCVAISLTLIGATALLKSRVSLSRVSLLKRIVKRENNTALAKVIFSKSVSRLSSSDFGPSTLSIIVGEIRLILQGRPWWFYLGILLCIGLPLLLPHNDVVNKLLPVLGLLPILVMSTLGCKPYLTNTLSLVNSTPISTVTRLLCEWAAALSVIVLVYSGVIARFVIEGQSVALLNIGLACVFLTSAMVFLGVLTKTNRTSEGVLIFVWYMGSLERMPHFDFMGITQSSSVNWHWLWIAVAAVAASIVIGAVAKKR